MMRRVSVAGLAAIAAASMLAIGAAAAEPLPPKPPRGDRPAKPRSYGPTFDQPTRQQRRAEARRQAKSAKQKGYRS